MRAHTQTHTYIRIHQRTDVKYEHILHTHAHQRTQMCHGIDDSCVVAVFLTVTHAVTHTDTQTHRHTDSQTHSDIETQRHRDTETLRHAQNHRHALLRNIPVHLFFSLPLAYKHTWAPIKTCNTYTPSSLPHTQTHVHAGAIQKHA